MPTIDRGGLNVLFEVLRARGYHLIGPVLRDGAVVYDTVHDPADLPAGWRDEQEAGSYRALPGDDARLFGTTVGPTSWKAFLHPPALRLWRAQRTGEQGFVVDETPNQDPEAPYAFIGVRPCDLSAIRILDRVLMEGPFVDTHYQRRREASFVVAANCTRAGATCFCDSMGTGPAAEDGFDLALTELVDEGRHVFTVEAGSERGREVLAELPHHETSLEEHEAARMAVDAARDGMGRTMHTAGLRDLLASNREHPHWDDVATRCMSCTNCTMVCPTCFCTTVEDVTDLEGRSADRVRRWDSCFTMGFSYVHGGSVRSSIGARYRQWITHKLSTWQDQFGSLGCVGCGRCITWCPVGIDITEEVRALGEPRRDEPIGRTTGKER
ncbi:MAG: 4Fe-4S dicluster domain-containing protein [Trueperaceae bacterium]|nr:4Fe-4S dicluster domain-containing protein [Trueperaceae bacterium]